MLLAVLSLALSGAALAGSNDTPAEVVLRPGAPPSGPSDGVVVEGCALFPAGRFPAGGPLRVRAAGAAVPAAVVPLALHPDASVRGAWVTARVPPRLAVTGGRLLVEPGVPPPPRRPITFLEDRNGVHVDAGAVAFLAVREGPSLLRDLEAGGRSLGGSGPVEVTVAAGRSRLTSAREGRRAVRLAREGTLRSAVVLAGTLVDEAGVEGASYRLRLTVTSGSPIVEGDLHVTPLRAEESATDLSLDLPFDVGKGRRVRFVGAPGGGRFAAGESDAEVVCLDGQRAVGRVDGARVDVDPALRLGVTVEGGRGLAVGAVQSELRARAPRSVVASSAGRLRVVLAAGDGAWRAGVPFRARFAWLWTRANALERALPSLASEPRPSLSPPSEAVQAALPGRSALGVDPLGVRDDPTPLLLARVDEAVHGEWGDLDFGDYRHPWGWANLEYDPAAAFLLRAVASEDARHADVARAMVDHWVRHDRSRGEGGVPAGLPFLHGREHRSLEWEAGHVFAEGLVLAALLLGDPNHRAAADAMRAALVGVVREAPRFEHEREYAWTLLALHDLALLGPDAAAEEAARELFDRLLARQDAGGWFRIDSASGEGGAAWSVTPWVTGGITAEAVFRHGLATGDTRAAAALDRIGAFLVGPARLEDGSFARRVFYAPDNGAPVAKSGRAGAVDELMIAAGIGRSLGTTGRGAARATVLDELVLRASGGIARGRLTPNAACRALVAVRSLADTRARGARIE